MSTHQLPQTVLREFRKHLRLSQVGLAMRVCWHPVTVSRLERGVTPFAWSHLDALVNARVLVRDGPWYQLFERSLVPTQEEALTITISATGHRLYSLLAAIKEALQE